MDNTAITPASRNQRPATEVENVFLTLPQANTSKHSSIGRKGPAPPPSVNPPSYRRAQSTPPEHTNDTQFRGVNRATTGHASEASTLDSSWSRLQLSKKKSQYFTEAFGYREPRNTARDRVTRDSVILAEVKLNCCVSQIPFCCTVTDVRRSSPSKNSLSIFPSACPRSIKDLPPALW